MRARTSSGTRRRRPPIKASGVRLSREERALLLQACRRYKNTLPIYLESVRSELTIIKSILRKLG